MSEGKYLLFKARLKKVLPKLSASERTVGSYIMNHPEQVIDSSVRALAEAANVSTATVVRFCHSCGFEGLGDLRLSLRREQRELQETEESARYIDVRRDDSIQLVKQKILGYHNMIVRDMLSDWNLEAYTYAADAVAGAGKVIIMGEGGSRSTAMNLFYVLSNLGIVCETYMDSVFEIMKVGQLKEGDVAIGVTYTGRLRSTIESLQLAKERGATTIGLIGVLDSPIIPYVDILLNTTELEKDYYDSALSIRISENLVVELLATLVAMRKERAVAPALSDKHVISIRRVKDEE